MFHVQFNILWIKFKATDAKERQHWINLIRAVAEYHGQNALKPVRPAPPTTETVKRSATHSGSTGSLLKSPGLIKSHSLRLSTKSRSPRSRPSSGVPQQPPLLANPIQEELKNIKDALTSVAEFQSSAVEALEVFLLYYLSGFCFLFSLVIFQSQVCFLYKLLQVLCLTP